MNPQFCGITNSGSRINFDQECQVCNNLDVLFYMDEPCHKAPFICSRDETCRDEYCFSKCNFSCPYNWQICVEGECVDECAYMDCEDCKYGTCMYKESYRSCTTDNDCFNRELSCVNNFCTDRCIHTKCGVNESCFRGSCYALSF